MRFVCSISSDIFINDSALHHVTFSIDTFYLSTNFFDDDRSNNLSLWFHLNSIKDHFMRSMKFNEEKVMHKDKNDL